MVSFVAFLSLLCVASAQLHGVCHSNVQMRKEDEVISSVIHIVDRNNNNIITAGELVVGIGEILQYHFHTPTTQLVDMTAIELIAVAAEYDIIIDREHFVQMWHERFGDALPFVRATFDAYDENKDGKLSVLEIENIRLHALDKADNGDGILTDQEFRSYLKFIYTC
ncbi:uncharacterized protein LOC112563163 [Pomacea canaliculata]|uniref:uncharacterized protein LOC112563163 n=1 Tax=Pomacea canaliculata TaxID=400727 RepID=UPI000D7397D2|nr:uncharacterized protein LOC112563163 [Pomacea canaliculata]